MTAISRIFTDMPTGRVAAELGIIVLGVLIALGADEWRQSEIEKATELRYRERLLADLIEGESRLNNTISRLESVSADLDFLISMEFGASSDDELVGRFANASAYGGSSERYDHDDTYDELISSGNLSMIESAGIRENLGSYYAFVNGELKKGFDGIPRTLLYDFGRLTGYLPVDTEFGDALTSESRKRIVEFVRDDLDSNYAGSLRLVRAIIIRNIGSARVGLSLNARLTERLRATIDAEVTSLNRID